MCCGAGLNGNPIGAIIEEDWRRSVSPNMVWRRSVSAETDFGGGTRRSISGVNEVEGFVGSGLERGSLARGSLKIGREVSKDV